MPSKSQVQKLKSENARLRREAAALRKALAGCRAEGAHTRRALAFERDQVRRLTSELEGDDSEDDDDDDEGGSPIIETLRRHVTFEAQRAAVDKLAIVAWKTPAAQLQAARAELVRLARNVLDGVATEIDYFAGRSVDRRLLAEIEGQYEARTGGAAVYMTGDEEIALVDRIHAAITPDQKPTAAAA